MNKALQIIKRSEILTNEDIDGLNNIQEELWDNFMHTQMFKTRFDMETSCINDLHHPTADSKYWQCQMEQQVHFHELVMLSYEYRKIVVEIKKLQRKLETEQDDLEQELIMIEIEKNKFILQNQEKVAKERIREIQEWHKIKEELKPKMMFGTDDPDKHKIVSQTVSFLNDIAQLSPYCSAAERSNLEGKAQEAVKLCQKAGLQIDHPVLRLAQIQNAQISSPNTLIESPKGE